MQNIQQALETQYRVGDYLRTKGTDLAANDALLVLGGAYRQLFLDSGLDAETFLNLSRAASIETQWIAHKGRKMDYASADLLARDPFATSEPCHVRT